MSPEKQRIAIAEAIGWKPQFMLRCAKCDTCYEAEPDKDYSAGVFCPECRSRKYVMVGICHVEPIPDSEMPDFINDLNAMHEAEKALENRCSEYANILFGIISVNCRTSDFCDHASDYLWHATAAQRAEAFLKTLNLWTNE